MVDRHLSHNDKSKVGSLVLVLPHVRVPIDVTFLSEFSL